MIRRPVRTVFPFVADAENAYRFRFDIVTVRRTSGNPTAAGATYHQVLKFAWLEVEVWLENTEHEPGRKLSFIAHGPGGGMTIRTAVSFQHIETAHTRVAVTTEGEAPSLSWLARRLQKREVESLVDLKRTLESRPSAAYSGRPNGPTFASRRRPPPARGLAASAPRERFGCCPPGAPMSRLA